VRTNCSSAIDAVSLIGLFKQLSYLLCDSSECMINRGIAKKINLSCNPKMLKIIFTCNGMRVIKLVETLIEAIDYIYA